MHMARIFATEATCVDYIPGDHDDCGSAVRSCIDAADWSRLDDNSAAEREGLKAVIAGFVSRPN